MIKKLQAYSQEINPMLRELEKQKELLKAFKETDEKAADMVQSVKDAQEALKEYLETADDSKEILEKIKDVSNDVKQAVKAAVDGTQYKQADVKAFFVARVKDKVEDVVSKGEVFAELEEALA